MIEQGIGWYPNQEVQEILAPDHYITGVKLASGQILEGDMVVVATGARPNAQLALGANIELFQGGIKTDDFMATNQPGIYAGGDVAVVRDQLSEKLIQSCLWPDAMLQGIIAAQAISGQNRPYPGAILINTSAFFGVKFASCGPVADPGHRPNINQIASGADYWAYLQKGGLLKGFVLIGNTSRLPTLRRALLTKQPFSTISNNPI